MGSVRVQKKKMPTHSIIRWVRNSREFLTQSAHPVPLFFSCYLVFKYIYIYIYLHILELLYIRRGFCFNTDGPMRGEEEGWKPRRFHSFSLICQRVLGLSFGYTHAARLYSEGSPFLWPLMYIYIYACSTIYMCIRQYMHLSPPSPFSSTAFCQLPRAVAGECALSSSQKSAN